MENSPKAIEHLLSRNVEEVIDRAHLERELRAGKKLRVKLGIDPTSSDLHLGHAVVLRKLREFQNLGCKIVLIIGDFTALIGDPSGRDKTRPPLSKKEVEKNMKDYLAQAGKIIDIKKSEIRYNSEWLGKLNGAKLLELLGFLSVQQIIEREDFKARLEQHVSIRMHELLYPVMQAYDSVAIKADIEIGGTDQLFNLMTGRTLMEKLGMKPQDIMTMQILEGTDGVKKMSKSLGNYIGLAESASEMFGKIMSLPDSLTPKYFRFTTDASEKERAALEKSLKPRDLKARLGFEIVKLYHGEKSARAAQEDFTKLFSRKEIPTNIPELRLALRKISLIDVVVASRVAKSKGEARRLIEQGAVDVDDATKKNPLEECKFKGGETVKIGKKNFFRVRV